MSQPVPPHVSPDLVHSFNIFSSPGMTPTEGGCPFKAMTALRDEAPRIFYSDDGRGGGNWVLTRAEDIRAVLQNPDLFSSKAIAGFSQLLGESWDLLPLESDPPDHAAYRRLLEPALTPKKMDELIPAIESYCNSLIDNFIDKGECEFVTAFAQRFPVMVFLTLFGLPANQLELFAAWAYGLLHGPEIADRVAAAQAIRKHLEDAMAERAKQEADASLLSRIVHGQIGDRPLSEVEKIGFAFMIFVGGLDTVASSLGFYFRRLAEDQPLQERLRAQPELVPTAIEEMLRLYSVVSTYRLVTEDTELAGVQLKAGDRLAFTLVSGNRDPKEVPEPDELRLDRGNKPHFSFGAGKHRCMGSHLARSEMAIAMRILLQRLPTFRLADGPAPVTHGGGVFGIKRLNLVWG